MDDVGIKRKLLGDMKQFARAEMARDLGRRHNRPMRLPWDAEEPAVDAAPQEQGSELDEATLSELSGVLGGN